MSPVFSHGDLRLYLLFLLSERPQHGYELIQNLHERFGGTYSPSAGTIYPRLAKLETEGLVVKVADGRKSVYSITAAGRAEVASRSAELERIELDVTDTVRELAGALRSGVAEAMRSLRADLAEASRDAHTAPSARADTSDDQGPADPAQPQAAANATGTSGTAGEENREFARDLRHDAWDLANDAARSVRENLGRASSWARSEWKRSGWSTDPATPHTDAPASGSPHSHPAAGETTEAGAHASAEPATHGTTEAEAHASAEPTAHGTTGPDAHGQPEAAGTHGTGEIAAATEAELLLAQFRTRIRAQIRTSGISIAELNRLREDLAAITLTGH